jgi:hypothetical protein
MAPYLTSFIGYHSRFPWFECFMEQGAVKFNRGLRVACPSGPQAEAVADVLTGAKWPPITSVGEPRGQLPPREHGLYRSRGTRILSMDHLAEPGVMLEPGRRSASCQS